MLGIDPLYVANEGKMVVIVAPHECETALQVLKQSRYGTQAKVIGRVLDGRAGRVTLRTAFGNSRILRLHHGELLPRIC